MISIAACDGEPSFACRLKRGLYVWEQETGIDPEYLEVTDSDDLVELCNERGHIDLVFLAHHPQRGADGIAAARGLKKADENLNIVLVTADRMIDIGFVRLQPLDILPLPFEDSELKTCIERGLKRRKELFVIRSFKKRIAIPIERICYISKKPYPDFRIIEIHCSDGITYQSYMKTEEVEQQLIASGMTFLRIRNSCFANPFFVHKISGTGVELFEGCCSGETELRFVRGYRNEALKAYKEYLERRTYLNSIAKYT